MKQENKLQKKEVTALTLPEELSGTWGATSSIDMADVKIPRILLMQGLSDLVSERKAGHGDIVRSTNGEILAQFEKSIEFIPILHYKNTKILKRTGDRFEYSHYEDYNPATSQREWTSDDGVDYRRDVCLNFYVLLPGDIEKEMMALKAIKNGEMPDSDLALLPCHITFQRTSYDKGRDLVSHFGKCDHFNIPPASSVFRLGSELIKDDKNVYYTFKVEKSRQTTMEELVICKKWYDTISAQLKKIVVDTDEKVQPVSKPVKADMREF